MIEVTSVDDVFVSGIIQTHGENGVIQIASQSDFELLQGLIEAKGGESSISIQGDDGLDINGRVISGLTEAGSLSEYNITGAGADISLVSSQGIRVGGLVVSADALTIDAGSDNDTGKSFELDVTGLLYTRGAQQLVINTPDDVEIRGKVFVLGDGSDFVVTSAQRVFVSNDVLADDQILITAGADITGVSFELLTAGSLTTTDGNVEIRGDNDGLIEGRITAAGAGSDAIVVFGDYVQLGDGNAPQSITASDDIIITVNNNLGPQSSRGQSFLDDTHPLPASGYQDTGVYVSESSTLSTNDADGNITLSDEGRVEIRGVLVAKGLRSLIDIDAGTEFILGTTGVIRTELADSEITVGAPNWVSIGGSIIAGVEITETVDGSQMLIRDYTVTGANSNITVTSDHRLDVSGAMTASETMTLSAQDDPTGVSIYIGGQQRTLGDNTELILDAPNDIRIFGDIYVDGENSDLRIDSDGQVYINSHLQVQDQVLINGGVSTMGDGISVAVTSTARVESFTVAAHDAAHPLQAGNPYQVSINGVDRVDVEGVVKSIGDGGDVSITAGDRLLIDNPVEADDQILLDGGDDTDGIGVLITTVGGLTSRGQVGGLIDIKSTDSVIMMGHLEARGTGADVRVSSERQVSIGGTTQNQGQSVNNGGFIQSPDRIELSGGADASGISVKVFADSEITTSEVDSHIQIDAVNDAEILGVLLAGGEVDDVDADLNAEILGVSLPAGEDGSRRVGRKFEIFGTEEYGEESGTSISIRSGNQIVIGLEIHAGQIIEAVGGGDAASGKSVEVFGSARVVTHSQASEIYLGGTDRIDILGSPYFREIEPAGWATHTNGTLPDDASFTVSLDLGESIATHSVTVGSAAATHGSIRDIVDLLQEALDSVADFKDDDGDSWFEVTLRNGKILFTTQGLDFSITGGANAHLLGLSNETVDAVRPAAHLSAVESGSEVTLDSAAKQQVLADTLPIEDRGTLSDDVTLRVTLDDDGTPVTQTVTVTQASTAANGNIWGLVDSLQLALDAVGFQDITVRVKDARLLFTSPSEFSIENVAHAELLGLSQPLQNSALHLGGKLYLGGFIESYGAGVVERKGPKWRGAASAATDRHDRRAGRESDPESVH